MTVAEPRVRHHARFESLVRFDLVLTTRTGLHIGGGTSPFLAGSELPVLRGSDGRPLVPGSSLRGVLRSGVEAVVAAVGLDRRRPMVPEGKDAADPRFATRWNDMGIVPRLFGRIGQGKDDFAYASRVQISDSTCRSEVALEVRDGVGIGRETRTAEAAGGAKFEVEVVPAGISFHGSVRLHDPDDFEVGLLAQALVMLDEGLLLLGGKSARGLGWMSVAVGEVHRVSSADLLAGTSAASTRRPGETVEPGPIDQRLGDFLQSLRHFAHDESAPEAREPRFTGFDPVGRPAVREEG